MKQIVAGLILISWAVALGQAETVSPFYARGYTVMPEPQVVKLRPSDFVFGPDWRMEVQGIAPNDVAIETVKEELEHRFRLKLSERGRAGVLRLTMAPNSISPGEAQDRNRKALAEQAYKIDLSREAVTITANAPAGLFYGVVTLVQMLKPSDGVLMLPEGHIEDWP